MARLILVPTPIGNLGDITLRALEVLRTADFVISEDTRRSQILLKHFDIRTPLLSFHDHSPKEKLETLMEKVASANTACTITDAGMPAVSDPGFVLVRSAIEKGIPVEVLPGPSAVLPALILSGFPCDRFAFEGFLPRKPGKRREILAGYKKDKRTLVFFESPYKLCVRLEELREILGERPVAVIREISKKFEETIRGGVSRVLEEISKRKVLGEVTVVVKGYEEE
jgi:16S rRNA (cytidine1402-2'-O)-methyltransferase